MKATEESEFLNPRRRGTFRWAFRAEDGRLRAGWRVAFLLLAFLLLHVVVAGVAALALVWHFGLLEVKPAALQEALFLKLPYWPLLASVAAAPGVCVLVWCFRRYLDRRSWRSLGFEAPTGREVAVGLSLGVVVILLTLLPLAAMRCAGWRGGIGSPTELILVLGILCVAAFLEELVARAYVLTNLREALGPVAAVLISSAIFAGFHLGNPHAGIVGVVNIFLAGVLLGTVFALTGRLWSAWALHVAWNATLGMVLGLPVSGLRLPSVIRLDLAGSDLATGGRFGLEGSLWNTVALGLIIVAVVGFRSRLFGRGSRPPQLDQRGQTKGAT